MVLAVAMTNPAQNPLSSSDPWNDVADGYAAEMPYLMGPVSARAIGLVAPASNAVVVDVACGPGTTALALAAKVRRVHALDFAPAMLARLRAAAAAAGLENIEAVEGDGQALPYADASFDAGFSMFGLMFFPDRPRGFGELLRVLRPAGVAVVSSWAAVEESSLMTLLFGAVRVIDPSRPAPKKDMLSLENPEKLREEMAGAGFEAVVIHEHEQSLAVPDGGTLWERMVRSSAPLSLLRKKLGEATWNERSLLAKLYLEEQLARTPGPLSTKALIAVGRKPA
jgi:SAM-dependent methyltransferase